MDYNSYSKNKDDLPDLSDIELNVPDTEYQNTKIPLSTEDQQYIADFGKLLPDLCSEPPMMNRSISEQDAKDFGQYVYALRAAAGFSRQALASTVGLSKAQLVSLENGKLPPTLFDERLLNDLALTFGLEVADLYLMLGQYDRLKSPAEIQRRPSPPQPTSEAAANQLSMLHEINLKMNQEIHLEMILQVALVEAINVIGADAGLIYLVNPDSLEDLVLKAQWPGDEMMFSRSAELRRSAEYTVSTGEIYHCPDIFEESLHTSPVDEEMFCALLSVPIRARHRMCGAIVMTNPVPYYFTISDEQFLLALSDQIAAVLTVQMLRTVSNTLARLNQKETLIRIVQVACYLMGTQSGAVVLMDPDTHDSLRSAIKFPNDEFEPRSNGLSRRVAGSNEPYLVFDVQKDPLVKRSTKKRGVKTILGMPIQIQHEQGASSPKTRGVIFINSMTPRQFDAQDIALLQNLAGQAAIAIENTMLYEASRRECTQLSYIISHLTSLHEATQQIRSVADLNTLLCLIAEEAARLVQADAADIVLRDHHKNRLTYCGCYQLACHIIDGSCFHGASMDQVVSDPNRVNRLDKEPDYEHSTYARESITALINIPLALNNQAEGILTVYSRKAQGYFTQQDQQILSLLAAQITVVIQTALNVRRHYQYTRTLEAWREGTRRLTGRDELPALVKFVLTQAVDLLRAEGGRLYLVDEQQAEFTLIETTQGLEDAIGLTVPIGDSVIGRVIKTRQPVSISDYRNWPHRLRTYDTYNFGAVVGLPIICGGEVWGAISIHDTDEKRSFSDEAFKQLTHFGRLAALLLENFDQLSGDATKLSRLKTLAQASCEIMAQAPSLSCQKHLKLVAMRIMPLFEVDNCEISLVKSNKMMLQGVFSRRQGGRVTGNFIVLPGDHIQVELGTLTPFHGQKLTIPWHTGFLGLPNDWAGDQARSRFPQLRVPLLKRDEYNESVVGLIRLTHSPQPSQQMAFDFGAGFSSEDEWLLRVFADAVSIILEDNIGQSNLPDWSPLSTFD